MRNLWRVLRALVFAVRGHWGRTDKAGKPYWHHLVTVAWIAYGLTHDAEAAVIGLLHDYVEDVDRRGWEPIYGRFGLHTVSRVLVLTRQRKESEESYARRVELGDRIVVAVKIADLLHNTMPGRLPICSDEAEAKKTRDRLFKYKQKLIGLIVVRTWSNSHPWGRR